MAGMIFGIQHFSIQDGKGIRTNIFLMGCPLKCIWCHNPEGLSETPLLSFIPDKCIMCGGCFEICPDVHISESGTHKLNRKNCKRCFKCVEICVANSLDRVGYEASVDEVIEAVMRDKRYYDSSGGGVTLTGGEPMVQFAFVKSILEECKSAGINTVIETSGFARKERFESILSLTDMFLYDIKESDPVLHKKYTGENNGLILNNLDYLVSRGAKIILRCPIIPGLNDRRDHLEFLAGLTVKYPQILGIELMPYHKLGALKSTRLGTRKQNIYEVPSDEMMKTISEQIESFGGKMRNSL